MNKFEQLIEFIINDEEDKAKELFHEVVVEKSREIYENLMAEEDQVEESTESEEEAVEESTDSEEEAVEESIVDEFTTDEALGGDAADDLVDEIEADETFFVNLISADNADIARKLLADSGLAIEAAADLTAAAVKAVKLAGKSR